METKIELVKKPEIKHALKQAGESVVKRLDDLNIDNLVATEDSVKSLKELRAELNKEATEYEAQRKAVKSAILNPYDEFEAIYNLEIKERYTKAITTLKDKIEAFETKVKDEKKANVKRYFDELCTAEKIDFVPFETVIPEINLSTTEKKYKDVVRDYITKVVDDLALINTNLFKAEIMVEYKKTLNASKAITTITERKEKEAEEQAKIKKAETKRRTDLLLSLGFTFIDFTRCYEYDHEITILQTDIENLTKEEFNARLDELKAKIDAKNKKIEEQLNEVAETVNQQAPEKPAHAVSAPTVEVQEEIFQAKFEVKGTRSQLMALSQYMKSNNLNYVNI